MSQLPAVYQDFISYINPAKIIAVVNLLNHPATLPL